MLALVRGVAAGLTIDPALTGEHLDRLRSAEREIDARIGQHLEAALELAGELFEYDYAPHHVQDRLDALIQRGRTRARRANNKEPIPTDLRWLVWERDDFTCVDCGTRRNLSIDHVIPEVSGGPMTLENLATRCKPCNSKKGTRMPA